MQWTSWIGLALGVVMVSAPKLGPPPVMLDLGPVVPTPVPSPKSAEKKRLITTITVQNSPEGESIVSFEATDVADEGKDKFRTLASKNYSLAEEKPELKHLRERILQDLRGIEREMLDFAELAGPPKERAPLQPGDARPH
ncbi:MAG: hypothetical protein ABSA52_01445 [Candidatus Binatia bacterium]|jgi:hypothetical protein